MLLPRFTIRRALIGMIAAGFIFSVVAFAIQAHTWAIAVSVAISSLLILFSVHAIFFWLSSLMATVLPKFRSRDDRAGPFATHRMPPQLIPPRSPDND